MRRTGKTTDLGAGLGRLVGALDKKSGGWTNVAIARAWEEVAGAPITQHTSGVHLRGDEMVVYVDSSAWAADLSALSALYLPRINQEIGKDLVGSIRFTVSNRVSRQRALVSEDEQRDAFYAPEDVAPIKLSEQERLQVEHSASVIKNDRLREAVVRATVADLELQKGRGAAKRREKPRDGL